MLLNKKNWRLENIFKKQQKYGKMCKEKCTDFLQQFDEILHTHPLQEDPLFESSKSFCRWVKKICGIGKLELRASSSVWPPHFQSQLGCLWPQKKLLHHQRTEAGLNSSTSKKYFQEVGANVLHEKHSQWLISREKLRRNSQEKMIFSEGKIRTFFLMAAQNNLNSFEKR